MDTTEPLRESVAAPGVWLIGFQSAPEVLRTLIAGEELGEQVDELPHLLLLGRRWMVGVICCHSVQEGPGATAQLFPVQGTLWILLGLCLCSSAILCSSCRLFLLDLHPRFKVRTSPAWLLFHNIPGLLLLFTGGAVRRWSAAHCERESFKLWRVGGL